MFISLVDVPPSSFILGPHPGDPSQHGFGDTQLFHGLNQQLVQTNVDHCAFAVPVVARVCLDGSLETSIQKVFFPTLQQDIIIVFLRVYHGIPVLGQIHIVHPRETMKPTAGMGWRHKLKECEKSELKRTSQWTRTLIQL